MLESVGELLDADLAGQPTTEPLFLSVLPTGSTMALAALASQRMTLEWVETGAIEMSARLDVSSESDACLHSTGE